jgi:transposase InsO family protein
VSVADRQSCIELVEKAKASGARRQASCEVLEVSLRTLERWEREPDREDGRRGPKTACGQRLSDQEKQAMMKVCNSPEYRDLSPWQIVARLADAGEYLGSESSFYRVLKQNELLTHRHNSKPRVGGRPKDLVARKPNEVWSWDITYLNSPIRGAYYYLYLVEDIYSRKIVGWRIEEVESSEYGARLIERICAEQVILKEQLTIHSDNGAPMKGATLLATLERLGVACSFSRPGVSDDNPYSESLFKTLKYRPSYPERAFAGIDQARAWVSRFVQWYNREHLHSAIRFVTPEARHQGQDPAILAKRTAVYEQAKRNNPLRWSGPTRNWSPVTEVFLNPKRHKSELHQESILATTALATPLKTSILADACTQIASGDGVDRKNGFHNYPITNASESGKGLPRVENRRSHRRSRSTLAGAAMLCKTTVDYSVSGNLD